MTPVADAAMFPRFDRRFFESDDSLTSVGSGSLGGKAMGLAFARDTVLSALRPERYPDIEVDLPRATVIGTDLFDAFVRRNALDDIVGSCATDDRIAHAFLHADLPAELVGDLRGLVDRVRAPLAVRSSSMLEDSLAHPFAGVYATKMIPNNQHGSDERFRKLVEAVKFVYASTFFAGARSYRRSVGAPQAAEKMAVIIQEVVGRRHGDRFHPDISGVARSFDHYAGSRGATPSDGVVSLAVGLGKTIVDGGLCWTYSPGRPGAPPPFGSVKELLEGTQTRFWTVNMAPLRLYDPLRETEYLEHAWVADARGDHTLRLAVSTCEPGTDRLRPGHHGGPLAVDFAPMLTYGALPLNECLVDILAASKRALGRDVEVEFALTHDPRTGGPCRLGFLQVRPMAAPGSAVQVTPEELTEPGVVVASTACVGNGCDHGIEDIVYLRPEAFAAQHTRAMADELASINDDLLDAGRRYLLIGFGRWGSSEPWLGVPVAWGQISGAAVIVEATLPGMNPEVSQGSHFFQNMMNLRVLYLSLPHEGGLAIDWDWLDRQETVRQTTHVKHVRTAAPVRVKVDGTSHRGVITRGE